MSDLKNYKATINGIEHTFLLNEEDAKARGLTSKDAISDADLSTSPLVFDEPTTDGEQVEANVVADQETKSRTVSNKSRTAADK